MDNINYSINIFHKHLKKAGLNSYKIKNKAVLEMGPGNGIGTALIRSGYSANSYFSW